MQYKQLAQVPNQRTQFTLDGRNVQIDLDTRDSGLFASITIDGVEIESYVLCEHGVALIRDVNSPLAGNFYFVDLEGDSAPVYTGFNERWVLVYR